MKLLSTSFDPLACTDFGSKVLEIDELDDVIVVVEAVVVVLETMLRTATGAKEGQEELELGCAADTGIFSGVARTIGWQ